MKLKTRTEAEEERDRAFKSAEEKSERYWRIVASATIKEKKGDKR